MIKKAKRLKKSNKFIYGFCTIIAVVIIITTICVIIFSNKPIDESFFVSDNTKYVLTTDSAAAALDNINEYIPEKTHLVYFYSGDKVTDLKKYYKFENEEIARKAADLLKTTQKENNIKHISVNGKYVIATAGESVYKDITASEAKQRIDSLEAY